MTIALPFGDPLPLSDSIWLPTNTKRQIIEMAYEECSLAGYEFNLTPEELSSGLRKLDALMARWKAASKDLLYNFPAIFGEGDLDELSGVPDAAVEGAAMTLAMALAPAMGKAMTAESRARLSSAMSAISTMCAKPAVQGWSRSTIAGAGNRHRYGVPYMVPGR